MIGGVERYYQVAKCYRDEDFRADRQIEFTQLDFEGSFWGQEDVLEVLEKIARRVVDDLRGAPLEGDFARLTYSDAMARYGSDKPDIRFGMELIDLSEAFSSTDFKAFAGGLASGGAVQAINAGQLGLARSGLDAQVSRAQELGAKGLVWMVAGADGAVRSPVAKFLSESEIESILSTCDAQEGDTLLIVADKVAVVRSVLGQLRLETAQLRLEAAAVLLLRFPLAHPSLLSSLQKLSSLPLFSSWRRTQYAQSLTLPPPFISRSARSRDSLRITRPAPRVPHRSPETRKEWRITLSLASKD
jgi:aspartyl-tRNA synthetase